MGAAIQLRRDPLTTDEHQRAWQALCDDETLAGIAYKIETDSWGGVLMSPTQTQHSRMVRRVARLLGVIGASISCIFGSSYVQSGPSLIAFVLASNVSCKVGRANVKPGEGVTWSGRCVDGLAAGPGTAQWLEKGRPTLRFDGTFTQGLLEGKGKMFGADGDRYEGDYKGGLRHGHGVYVSGGGGRSEGEYFNNLRVAPSAPITAANPATTQTQATPTLPMTAVTVSPNRVTSGNFSMRCVGDGAIVAVATKEPLALPKDDALVFERDGRMPGTDPAKSEAIAKSHAFRLLSEALAFADTNRPRDCPLDRLEMRAPRFSENVLIFKDRIPEQIPNVGTATAPSVPGLLVYAEHEAGIWHLYNLEYQREKKQANEAAVMAFAKKHSVVEKAVNGLYANPFAFEGERLLLLVGFQQMQSATTGLFYLQEEGILVVNDIPKGAFTKQGTIILAAKVLGNVKFDGVVGGLVQVSGMVPNLKFLGALICRDNRCNQMDEK